MTGPGFVLPPPPPANSMSVKRSVFFVDDFGCVRVGAKGRSHRWRRSCLQDKLAVILSLILFYITSLTPLPYYYTAPGHSP